MAVNPAAGRCHGTLQPGLASKQANHRCSVQQRWLSPTCAAPFTLRDGVCSPLIEQEPGRFFSLRLEWDMPVQQS